MVADLGAGMSLLHMDRIFMHDRTGGRMLRGVRESGRTVRNPQLAFGTFDHLVDTHPGRNDHPRVSGGAEFIRVYREEAKIAGVSLIELDDPRQGIAHVVAPEQGIALPGTTFVCGDSHTCTVGGLGALAWGIGITQGEHALATQTLRLKVPGLGRVVFDGAPPPGVSAKDMALAMISRHGATGGRNCAVEFGGTGVVALTAAGRMTLCNMAVEFGAWTGIVAPDDTTFQFLCDTPYAPRGSGWDRALAGWRALRSDPGAKFDFELHIDCKGLEPHVTWGTSSEHAVPISGVVPDPAHAVSDTARATILEALRYTGLRPGQPMTSVPVEAAFIGSCTNSRIEDLRVAASILAGRTIAPGVLAICVPGSTQVKRQAEAEGLHRVFLDAGFEWRESGCSLCFYSGGDSFGGSKRVISTTNRNFQNRQGPGVSTHLASPATVAASAVAGRICDPRLFLQEH